MSYKDKTSWNEFEWELELRKDDARVAAYIAELPKYIDLPDEDNIIMRTISRRGGLDKEEDNWTSPGPVPYNDGEQGEEDDSPFPSGSDNWKSTDGGTIYHNASVLARDFSVFASPLTTQENREPIMRLLSLYGKLLARSADLIDMSAVLDPEEFEEPDPAPAPLRIAVCKRLLADLNSAAAEIKGLCACDRNFLPHMESHAEVIGIMHDALVDLLDKLRSPAAEEDAPPDGELI